jgi:tetratricopeptide (TPR) repeat protein
VTETPPTSRHRATVLLGIILLLTIAAVFSQVRHFQFVNWDDFDELVENPLLNPPTTAHLLQIWSAPYLRLYAPLSYTLWWVVMHNPDAATSPGAFHVLSAILHLVAVLLVYSILRLCVKNPVASFGGAIIFALHPLQVESVAWVAETNNLLAAALSLAAIRLYLAFRTATSHRHWLFSAATLLFLLALFSKPTAVIVPLIAAVLDLAFLHSAWRKTLISLLPWLILSAIFAWIAHASQSAPSVPWPQRPAIALDALAFYLGKIIWPVGLTIDYGRTPARVIAANLWLGNLAIVAAVSLVLALVWQTQRAVTVGAIVFLIGILPILGFVPFGFQEYSTVADHFLYLAMLGPALAAAAILAAVPPRFAWPAAAALAIGLAFLCHQQLQIWRDSAALVQRAFKVDKGSSIASDIVGAELDRAGKPSLAIPYFKTAVARDPANPFFNYNLANAYFQTDEYDNAIRQYQIAIPLFHPLNWKPMNNLAVSYIKVGRISDAIDEYHQILQIDPRNAAALNGLQILTSSVRSK